MGKTEKKINKILIGAIIGSAVLGVGGLSMTPKGKSFWRRMFRKSKKLKNFFVRGFRKMKRDIWGFSNKNDTGSLGNRRKKKQDIG